MSFETIIAAISLLAWIFLALFRGRFWWPLTADAAIDPDQWPSIDIIVPARNEADVLPRSLQSLLRQDYPGSWRILLIDDHSTDGTGDIARQLAKRLNLSDKFETLNAPDLPKGWSGKVAAMQAGVTHSTADYILFTDADIEHETTSLRKLAARAVERHLDLTSLMVKLHCTTVAENLLIPAFVFFFAMLYPFSQANDPDSAVAAAAGGVMLVRRKALNNIGGLASLKSALIDDCTLAKNIKQFGGDGQKSGRIELTLATDAHSIRPYDDIAAIWHMIARTAFTQLHHSALLLVGTIIGMALVFLAPWILVLTGTTAATIISLITIILMILLYLPMIRFYDLAFAWALALPAAAIVYIGATIDSARQYWQGKGGNWKGRNQAS